MGKQSNTDISIMISGYLYTAGGMFALLSAIIFFYPAFLYIFLFLLYSVILVAIGKQRQKCKYQNALSWGVTQPKQYYLMISSIEQLYSVLFTCILLCHQDISHRHKPPTSHPMYCIMQQVHHCLTCRNQSIIRPIYPSFSVEPSTVSCYKLSISLSEISFYLGSGKWWTIIPNTPSQISRIVSLKTMAMKKYTVW